MPYSVDFQIHGLVLERYECFEGYLIAGLMSVLTAFPPICYWSPQYSDRYRYCRNPGLYASRCTDSSRKEVAH